jgi:hypothetical protein
MIAIIEIETPVWSHWSCRHFDAMVLQHDVLEYLTVGTQGCHALFAHDFAIEIHMISWPYPRHHDHLRAKRVMTAAGISPTTMPLRITLLAAHH